MKSISSVLSMITLVSFMIWLSSCGGSSPAPTTVKPGAWTSLSDFGGFGRSASAYFVIGDKGYVGG
ncbi:MAG: hypothetical protein ACKODM_14890, partial [Cytophagales bacterium]